MNKISKISVGALVAGLIVAQYLNTSLANDNFNIALRKLYLNEGGYTFVKNDSGGETYRGISRKNWPKWAGWQYVDRAKPLKQEQVIKGNASLDNEVANFYKINFWFANHLDKIKSTIVSVKVLDMTVNMGSSRGTKLLQQALKVCHCNLLQDGVLGPHTYNSVNSCNEDKLHKALINVSVEFYQGLVVKNHKLKKFLNNWLERARQ